jgi:hypothetical protein
MNPSDRRKSPRLDVDGPLSALALSASSPKAPVQVVQIVNVSFGGFLVESATPFVPGDVYDFRFRTSRHKRPAVFKARAIYRVEQSFADPATPFSCGFAFINADDPFTLWRIRELIHDITSALSADEPAQSSAAAGPATA